MSARPLEPGAARSAADNPAPAPPVAVRPIGLMVASISLILVVTGLALPQMADSLIRLLVVVAGIGWVGARMYTFAEPLRRTEDLYLPFAQPAASSSAATAPQSLQSLTMQLRTVDDAAAAVRTALPPNVHRALRAEAARRLMEHHRLDPLEPDDHPRIRALISPSTWELIRPHHSKPGPPRRASLTMSQLGLILDDLERL